MTFIPQSDPMGNLPQITLYTDQDAPHRAAPDRQVP